MWFYHRFLKPRPVKAISSISLAYHSTQDYRQNILFIVKNLLACETTGNILSLVLYAVFRQEFPHV